MTIRTPTAVRLIILICAFAAVSLPAAKPADQDSEFDSSPSGSLRPRLGPAGLQRLNKSIETLSQNIKDAETNLSIVDKNLRTLQNELDDVDSLEREHRKLEEDYQKYIADANKQIYKTDVELTKIAKMEREVASTQSSISTGKGPAYDAQKIEADKSALLDWKADAIPKIKKVSVLISELKENLAQMNDKRAQLKKELSLWANHRKEFDSLLKQYHSKKAALETLADQETD